MWKENIKINLEKMSEAESMYYTEYMLSTSIAQEMIATDSLMAGLILADIANDANVATQERCGLWRT